MNNFDSVQARHVARPISRLLASELTPAEIDMVAGGFEAMEVCGVYTQTCTRDRYGNDVDCGPVKCDG